MQLSQKIPPYPGGRPLQPLYNAGGMLDASQECPMQLIADTDEDQFAAYVQHCLESGWQLEFRNETPGASAAEFWKDGTLFYTYLTKKTGVVRILEDRVSTPLSQVSYSLSPDRSVDIVQYGMPYASSCTQTGVNCGMFFILKLADGGLFLIDGGHCFQWSAEAVDALYKFLREFSGVRDGTPLRIAGWFFTHPHGDHLAACPKLLCKYHRQIRLERILFNFYSDGSVPGCADADYRILQEVLRRFCPDAMMRKLHTAQKITLANAQFEVLYTHEDAVAPERPDAFAPRDVNASSTVVRMCTGGGSVLWLGDANRDVERIVCSQTQPQMWKSDVVQVAHHGFNHLPLLYRWIDGDYALVPNSPQNCRTEKIRENLQQVIAHLPDKRSLWYGDVTTGFRFSQGRFVPYFTRPCAGGTYDFTDLYGRAPSPDGPLLSSSAGG